MSCRVLASLYKEGEIIYFGRHTDVLVRSIRPDGSVRYILRQRQFAWPEPVTVILEIQDKRTREEARADWEALRALGINRKPSNRVFYSPGLPKGWIGLWDDDLPKVASPIVRRAINALEGAERPLLRLEGHGESPADVRKADVYSRGDTVVYSSDCAGQSKPAIKASLMLGTDVACEQELARPVFGTKFELTISITLV